MQLITNDLVALDADLGATKDAVIAAVVAQIERLAQDRPEALIGGAFAVGFALAMVVRRLVR